MADTLPKYLSGEIVPQPQPAEGATYSPKIGKADAQIDWRRPAIEIERMVRRTRHGRERRRCGMAR